MLFLREYNIEIGFSGLSMPLARITLTCITKTVAGYRGSRIIVALLTYSHYRYVALLTCSHCVPYLPALPAICRACDTLIVSISFSPFSLMVGLMREQKTTRLMLLRDGGEQLYMVAVAVNGSCKWHLYMVAVAVHGSCSCTWQL